MEGWKDGRMEEEVHSHGNVLTSFKHPTTEQNDDGGEDILGCLKLLFGFGFSKMQVLLWVAGLVSVSCTENKVCIRVAEEGT